MNATIERTEEAEMTQEELDAWADAEYAQIAEMEDGRLVMEAAANGLW